MSSSCRSLPLWEESQEALSFQGQPQSGVLQVLRSEPLLVGLRRLEYWLGRESLRLEDSWLRPFTKGFLADTCGRHLAEANSVWVNVWLRATT